jgi:hypothetical protein
MSFPIHDFEIRAVCHRDALLTEAVMERLARQVPRPSGRWNFALRARVATALYAVAVRIDTSAVPVAISPTVRSISTNGTR